VNRVLHTLEQTAAGVAIAAMVLLPIAEIILRRTAGIGIPASGPIVQHLVLWVGFLGAGIAARQGTLLAMSTGSFLPEGRFRRLAQIFAAAAAGGVVTLLAWGAVQLVLVERESGSTIGAAIPTWVAQLVLPIGLIVIAVRVICRSSTGWTGRAIASCGAALACGIVVAPQILEPVPAWFLVTLCVVAGALGAPIFSVLGGIAVLLFMKGGVAPATVLVETYALTTSPTLAAIPLFTLAGFALAEGHASARLLRVFRAWVGWIPGGTAVVCAVLCSFFTAFTGGSGVTILALGGLLLPALISEGYRDRFALGLLTASGSLGLLLPPALPLILYGVVARLPIEDLFLGGMVPGVLLTAMIAAWGVREGMAATAGRSTFSMRTALGAMWEAKWELAMPVVALAALFSGAATAIEAAALVALYAIVVQTAIHRDVSVRRDLLRVLIECVSVIGGVLIVLSVAVGLTSYLVDAQVPARLFDWTQSRIESPTVFLLGLNLFLLIVGCLMDIFSAIVVVVPLIVPLGAAFGIHPVHLGIIFVANLELGYLTPPVGLNLFLASYRFKRPLLEVCRAALPPLAILAAGVLLITYVPALTLGVLRLLGRTG
jgi:tripartite ATP-independent transporter DctM subunit